MYELIQAGDRTYYIDCPTKVGIYRTGEDKVWLIDSGNDKDGGRKVLKIVREQGWSVEGIVNTHSNADHIGGNEFIQSRTGCAIVSTPVENAFTQMPILESSFLYGGYPCKALRNKFLLAQSSNPTGTVDKDLPQGLTTFSLPGHYFGMIGVGTDDGVCFLADCVFSETVIAKYHLSFIYDVQAFLDTLDQIDAMEATLFVPSHAPAVEDIRPLSQINRAKVLEIAAFLEELCATPSTFEELLEKTFAHYGLTMDFNQYVLIGSTVRSYLSYLYDQGKVTADFVDNRMLWRRA